MASDLNERYLGLGKAFDAEMARASIERCNCMIRYNGGPQLPAIRRKKVFRSPEGHVLCEPTTFEDMHRTAIARLMAERNEVYIGHQFAPISGEEIDKLFKEP